MAISRAGRSQLGALFRSRLGALGSPREIILVLQRIAFLYDFSKAVYDEDLEHYNSVIAEHGNPDYGIVLIDVGQVYTDDAQDIDMHGTPEGFEVFDAGNTITRQTFIDGYNKVQTGATSFVSILLPDSVDGGVHVPRSEVDPPLNEFTDWLGVPWEDVDLDNGPGDIYVQRWLRHIALQIDARENA